MRRRGLLADKLSKRRVWRRIALERLTEPLHLNLLSIPVAALASYRTKIAWDLIVRQQYAYGALRAAEETRAAGLSEVTLVEMGVASGAGLANLAAIAERLSHETGVTFHVHGFDTGSGMPAPVDYRDHPDLYGHGDFQMDVDALRAVLPPSVGLHLGPLSSTVPEFLSSLDPSAPVGFVALDVDYHSSTVDALEVLKGAPDRYLPTVTVYVDDIALDEHNSAAGALLAIREFNAAVQRRPLERHDFLESHRIFRRATWIRQTFFCHVLDHPRRSRPAPASVRRYIENPYLRSGQPEENFHPDG